MEAFFGWKNAISMHGRVARGRGAAEIRWPRCPDSPIHATRGIRNILLLCLSASPLPMPKSIDSTGAVKRSGIGKPNA
jgi:hypothetical protein